MNPYRWFWYDAWHYLSIGRFGYWIMLPGRFDGRGGILGDPIGNTGWFPAYSYLIRALSPGHGWDGALALWISAGFALGSLMLMWQFIKPHWNLQGFLALTAAGMFPCFLFLHAISPVSMLLFESLLFMLALLHRRFVAATIVAIVASFTYSTGFILAGVAGLWLLTDRAVPWKTKILVTAGIGLVSIYTVQIVFWIQDTQSHTIGAFYQRQAEFENTGFTNPLLTLWRYVKRVFVRPGMVTQVPLVAGALALAIVAYLRNRRTWLDSDRLLLSYCVVMLLFPLSVGNSLAPWAHGVQPWRPMALLSPLALLLRRMPAWMTAGVLIAEAILAAFAVWKFSAGQLV